VSFISLTSSALLCAALNGCVTTGAKSNFTVVREKAQPLKQAVNERQKQNLIHNPGLGFSEYSRFMSYHIPKGIRFCKVSAARGRDSARRWERWWLYASTPLRVLRSRRKAESGLETPVNLNKSSFVVQKSYNLIYNTCTNLTI
jgi:hypothetical protein